MGHVARSDMSGAFAKGVDQGPAPQPASQQEINDSPRWHLYDYEFEQQTFSLMRIEVSLYREASFLDSRVAKYNCPTVRYEMQHMARMFPRLGDARGATGFIFHIGHCGSTLLSRALAVSPRILPFREPVSLRSLSADRRELETPMSFLTTAAWDWLLTTVLDSLSRRFRADQVNVVKATSTGNNLIGPILRESPRHRAILLYVSLESYLATMLGKEKRGGDLWSQARTRMHDWTEIADAPRISLHQLREPHLAALSWLTSMNHMLFAREVFGDRLMMMDFEDLLADPESNLSAAAAFFGVEAEAARVVTQFPQVSSAYSKRPDRRFTPETRAHLLDLTRQTQADDIATGDAWARSQIAQTPVLERCSDFLA
jgi:hypothetical protein